MSATIDATKFAKYFGRKSIASLQKQNLLNLKDLKVDKSQWG